MSCFIEIRTYDDKGGKKRKATEIKVDDIEFAGGRQQDGDNTTAVGQQQESQAQKATQQAQTQVGNKSDSGDNLEDDELPF